MSKYIKELHKCLTCGAYIVVVPSTDLKRVRKYCSRRCLGIANGTRLNMYARDRGAITTDDAEDKTDPDHVERQAIEDRTEVIRRTKEAQPKRITIRSHKMSFQYKYTRNGYDE